MSDLWSDSVEKLRGCGAAIRLIHSGVKVHLALGCTDLRKGLDGLAILVQRMLELNPFSGHMFVFRGRRADLMKTLGLGWQRSITKRLEGTAASNLSASAALRRQNLIPASPTIRLRKNLQP
jgi:IS66 Orf2 like protein